MPRRAAAGAQLTRPAPAYWPGLNDRVWVELQLPDTLGGELIRLPTRVEDATEGSLLVAAPSFRGDLHVVAPGLPVTVAWVGPRGQHRQDFLLAEAVRRRVAVWDLAPCSDLVTEQRRRYARVPATGAVLCAPVDDDPLQDAADAADGVVEPVMAGLLVDVSEGGAAINVPAGTWLRLGRLVRLSFEVLGSAIDQPGQIVRSLESLAPDRLEVVVSFSEPVAAADVLRRYVMQTQIKQRRGGD